MLEADHCVFILPRTTTISGQVTDSAGSVVGPKGWSLREEVMAMMGTVTSFWL